MREDGPRGRKGGSGNEKDEIQVCFWKMQQNMVRLYEVGERKGELRLILPFRNDGALCRMGKGRKG